MSKKTYNKLIRDKIPEIILADGRKPKVKILSKRDFLKRLKEKLVEEAKELQRVKNKAEIKNEIVDVQEILLKIAKIYKISPRELEEYRKKKKNERGGFKKKLFLVSTNK